MGIGSRGKCMEISTHLTAEHTKVAGKNLKPPQGARNPHVTQPSLAETKRKQREDMSERSEFRSARVVSRSAG
jgi:hypothetical protein